MALYTLQFDDASGAVIGVTIQGGGTIPANPNNSDWQAFITWNAQQQTPLNVNAIALPVRKVRRPLLSIRSDLGALTPKQQGNIWTNFTSGSPAVWMTDTGPNAAALMALVRSTLNLVDAGVVITAADLLESKLEAVTIYVQDNPSYLVAPAFDPTIAVQGAQ